MPEVSWVRRRPQNGIQPSPTARNGGVICGRFGFTASILAESRNDTDRVDGCGVGGAVGTPSQGREAPRVTAENYGMFILGRNTERNNAEVGEVRPCYYWNGTK